MKGKSEIMEKRTIESMLSPEFRVAVKIYELTEKTKPPEVVHYSRLVELLEGDVSKVTISKSLDNLLDVGIVDAKWTKKNSKWVRAFRIAGEARGTIRIIYEHIQRGK